MRVSLPEQVWLNLRPAGFGSRGLAYIVDFLIRWSILTIVVLSLFLLLLQFGPGTTIFDRVVDAISSSKSARDTSVVHLFAVLGIFIFLIEWSYPVYFELRHQGVTPGKKLFGLRVVDEQGLPIGFQASALRTLLLIIDFLPALGFVAFIAMLVSKRSRRIGDIVAGTLVIYEATELYPLPGMTRNAPATETIRLPEQTFAILDQYVRRRGYFTDAARNALRALLTKALTPHLTPYFSHPISIIQEREKWLEQIYLCSIPEKRAYAGQRR